MSEYEDDVKESPLGLSMKETEAGELRLMFEPDDFRFKIDATTLRHMAVEKGYGELDFDENAIAVAAQHISKNEAFVSTIAQRRDAEYRVYVSADRLVAQLQVTPSYGGTPISEETARHELAKARVVFGFDEAAFQSALTNKLGEPVTVAKGVAPIPGRDTRFEPLVEVNRERVPRANEDGRVNWRDLGDIPMVSPGDVLMRRHPPEQGKSGRDVFDNILQAPDGKNLDYPYRLEGAERDANDPDLLRATSTGQPVLLRDSVKVEPVIKTPGVNVSTGNITFVGSLVINGDVQSGMHVKVDGDVTVHGTVEAAIIEAGGSITVNGGIVGQNAQQRESNANGEQAKLHAKANVRAKYAENALIIAEQSVYIDEAVIECDITALNRVEIGVRGRRKGYIMGGRVRATLGIKAEYLGGAGSRQTRVQVGVNPLLQQRIDEKKAQIAALAKEEADLNKLIRFLADKPDKQDVVVKAKNTMRRLLDRRRECFAEERALVADANLSESAKVEVSAGVYSGTTVNIGKQSTFVTEDSGFGVFRLEENQLIFSKT